MRRVLLCAAFLSLPAMSADLTKDADSVIMYKWTNDNDGIVSASTSSSDDGFTLLRAQISLSKGGTKRMYFDVFTSAYKCKDDKDFEDIGNEDFRTTHVWKIGEKFVKMIAFCSANQYSVTPLTQRGALYVQNKFATAKGSVRVIVTSSHQLFEADVSAEGFSKQWNDFGEDAI